MTKFQEQDVPADSKAAKSFYVRSVRLQKVLSAHLEYFFSVRKAIPQKSQTNNSRHSHDRE
jgi:hypothetical protein